MSSCLFTAVRNGQGSMPEVKDGLYRIKTSTEFRTFEELVEVSNGLVDTIACSRPDVNGLKNVTTQFVRRLEGEAIDLKDLPLYISWPSKSYRYEELLKTGETL
jgi:hypothetical protein